MSSKAVRFGRSGWLRHMIDPARMKGMAFAKPFHREPRAFDRTMKL